MRADGGGPDADDLWGSSHLGQGGRDRHRGHWWPDRPRASPPPPPADIDGPSLLLAALFAAQTIKRPALAQLLLTA